MMKICSRCQESKNSSEFGKRASSKDGLDSRCLKCIKECSKQSTNKNRVKNCGGNIVSSKLCPTCRLFKSADCFGTNPGSKDGLRNECKDCRNTKTRRKYKTNPDFKVRESVRASLNYLENKERILNRTKKWSKENPEKKVEQRHRRVARLYGQIEFDLPKDFINLLKRIQGNCCCYCLKNDVKLTVEHVMPLSRGGKHCFDNVVLVCTTCNFSKHNKTLEEWLEHNRKLQNAGIVSDTLSIICNNLIELTEICMSDQNVINDLISKLGNLSGWKTPFPGLPNLKAKGKIFVLDQKTSSYIAINPKGQIHLVDEDGINEISEEKARDLLGPFITS